MTSRADEIQKLIADIDNLLANNGKRLSKLLSNPAQEGREVLDRIRDFLVRLGENESKEKADANQPPLPTLRSPLLAKFVDQVNNQSTAQHPPSDEEQNLIQPQPSNSELATLLQPLQAELSTLLQERASLVQEIRQLEQKRLHNYSLSQQMANQEQIISEFLQVLMSRLVPNLTPHIAQNSANSPSSPPTNYHTNPEPITTTTPPVLPASDQTERLTQLARDLDQRLLSLDGTVNVVFEALQRNINTYHESLSQALARMHSQGVQGEQLMASFFANLTQYLQQQSLNFQPSEQTEENYDNYIVSPAPTLVTNLESTAAQPQAASTTQQVETVVLPPTTTAAVAPTELQAHNSELNIESSAPTLQPQAASTTQQAALTPTELQPDNSELNIESSAPTLLIGLESTAAQPVTPSVPVINSEPQTVSTTQEVETVVVPATTTPGVTATASQPDNSELDEVDQLYASLFGSNEVAPTVATNDLPALNIADTPIKLPTEQPLAIVSNELPALNIADTPVTLPTEQLDISDPWVEQTDIGLVERSNPNPAQIPAPPVQSTDSVSDSWETLFFDEEPEPAPVISQPVTPPPQVNATERFSNQPTEAETIKALTDLLADVSINPQPQGILSRTAATAVVTNVTQKSEVVIHDDEAQRSKDNYIPASPQENLLSHAENQVSSVPDIFLDEAQLQQLDRDLANFDNSLNSQSLSTTNKDSSQQQTSPEPIFTENQISPPLIESQQIIEKKTDLTNLGEQTAVAAVGKDSKNPENNGQNFLDSDWYLGIDLGTTGISATLLNRSNFVVHPIYWLADNQSGASSFQQSFRLPAEVYLPTASAPHKQEIIEQTAPVKDASSSLPKLTDNLYSAQLKPYLQVAIPYKSTRQKWEPVLQFNEFSAGPLIWVVRSLSKLLLTLKSDRQSTTQGLTAAAVGIEPQIFGAIIHKITGVICTCPANWSEQYRFNVREALLTSKIIQHPQQVFFVEEAIATLLSVLNGGNNEKVQLSDRQGLRSVNSSENPFVGNTLAINIGATATEMALVDLPENLGQLTHNDFMLHSFAYAGKGIEQDIICQLLLPPKSRQSRPQMQSDNKTITSNPWHWQPSIPGLDQMRWQSLGLEELELPRVGEPDITARICLQQRLESSLLGQAVLDAALALKLILQHQEAFTLDLADQRWVLQRRDLESQVLVPFVRRLNRELNKLLVARGIPTEAINQAILTGGMAAIPTIQRWLRQKLPNARIIQDAYLGDNGAPNCSRVAHGLAMLPLHPQVLEIPRQQYTDYFLFTELLRLLPERTLSFGEIIQLFEARGINTRTCQQRLMAFLEGELPAGLVPLPVDSSWLTKSSHENIDYKAIASAPLFEKQGSLTYRPNSQQLVTLRRYLDGIQASTQQSLQEPYTVNFALEVPAQ